MSSRREEEKLMFSRNADRSSTDAQRATPSPQMSNVRELSAAPAPPPAPTAPTDTTVVARGDRLDGTLKVNQTLRIAGTLEGKVEATTVYLEEGSTVKADITADEVVIAGEYQGKLICRQRLEMRATGQVTGTIETLRLMLHEGASIDGELHMVKPAAPEPASRGGSTVRGGLAEVPIRATSGPGDTPGAPVAEAAAGTSSGSQPSGNQGSADQQPAAAGSGRTSGSSR
jgi:cytoskeletal protein CcmA (bactofilin family)